MRLPHYDVWAVARYAEVRRVLSDWETFCSSRDAGLTDFAKRVRQPAGDPAAGVEPLHYARSR